MRSWIKNSWKWFDGKKTYIGLVLLLLAEQPFFINHTHPDGVSFVAWLGLLLSGVGIAHKGVKQKQSITKAEDK